MSDGNLVACNEDHEMKYVLQKFNKSAAKENVEQMRDFCKKFKADPAYKPHNREGFYKYLADKKLLTKMK